MTTLAPREPVVGDLPRQNPVRSGTGPRGRPLADAGHASLGNRGSGTSTTPPCAPVLDDDVDLVRDRALVERAQAGDRSAFDDLYLRYHRRLYRFCLRRLQDDHEAEDVAQEAFARAWRALPSFAGDRRFYPWLSVIAAHLCTDVLRRRKRSTPVAELHQVHQVSTEDGGEERVVAAVDSDLVAQAFTRLSVRHQRILALREGSGWSYQMIADHEGVGITAIETLLWRARQALKREFTTLAGSDGRLAGLAGALLGLAALRRLVRSAAAAGRRLATSGPWAATAITTSLAMAMGGVLALAHMPVVGSSTVTASPAGHVTSAPEGASHPTTATTRGTTAPPGEGPTGPRTGHGDAGRLALPSVGDELVSSGILPVASGILPLVASNVVPAVVSTLTTPTAAVVAGVGTTAAGLGAGLRSAGVAVDTAGASTVLGLTSSSAPVADRAASNVFSLLARLADGAGRTMPTATARLLVELGALARLADIGQRHAADPAAPRPTPLDAVTTPGTSSGPTRATSTPQQADGTSALDTGCTPGSSLWGVTSLVSTLAPGPVPIGTERCA